MLYLYFEKKNPFQNQKTQTDRLLEAEKQKSVNRVILDRIYLFLKYLIGAVH